MTTRKRVLILCTGNSCRSQMAEALINARLGERWQAFSAGTEPASRVHPKAIQVLAEIGIQHQGAPKGVDEFREQAFDLVVTVCEDAAQNCPVWLGRGVQQHIGFPDPAQASGSEEEILAVFRQVREAIAEQVLGLLRDLENGYVG
ncbi:MAG TPA: arsenate reductase ArsC [Anaerolineales bacterium]|nr:arsenate reductase ArsC [Anaerolineales bacterium]